MSGGRPKLPEGQRLGVQRNIRFRPDTFAALAEAAATRGVTVAEEVRLRVERSLIADEIREILEEWKNGNR